MRRLFHQLSLALFFTVQVVCAGPIEDCKEFTTFGVPTRPGGPAGELLCRKGYLLSHDPVRKTPLWVVEHLTREKVRSDVERSDDFRADAELDPGKRAELSDYRGSGYDRGHMAPAADMAWDEQAMSESFYLSNMVPQVGIGMNRGIWMELEKKVRIWARERGELYVYSGPIYHVSDTKTIGNNKVAVPSFLYKIVLDPRQKEAIALIMPNRKLRTEDLPNYLVSVREVETETGLNFFSILPTIEQDKLDSLKAPRLWQ
jgi:endonuclease G, mitochondrial